MAANYKEFKKQLRIFLEREQKAGDLFAEDNNLAADEIKAYSSYYSIPEYSKKEEIWNKLSGKIENESKTFTLSNTHKLRKYWAVAASIVILLSVISTFYFSKTTIVCDAGEHRTVFLPDSSKVVLNATSEISYNKILYNWKRKIRLKGEAFFKVKKGREFSVSANNSITTVLGTSFNIYARNNNLIVSCLTGKVEVSLPKNNQEKVIVADQEVRKIANFKLTEPLAFNKEEVNGWLEGKFTFKRQALSEVFSEIERQFNVKIHCSGCDERIFSGSFYNNNLEEALAITCLPMKLKYTIDKNIINIINNANSN